MLARHGKQAFLVIACAFAVLVVYHTVTVFGQLQRDALTSVPLPADLALASSGLNYTTIPGGAHSSGFTVFDELFLRNGTLYVHTTEPSSFPPRKAIISRPFRRGENKKADPTDQEMQFIDSEEAKRVLGDHTLRLEGLTAIVYDPDQFLHHYYHWWGEIVLGFWRIYSKLSHPADTSLPFPARFILPFVSKGTWRDGPGIDAPLMRAAFPQTSIEQSDMWQDLARLNVTVVFSRAVVINRNAAHQHPFGSNWNKMIAGTMNTTIPKGFWEPVRRSLLKNVFGHVPSPDQRRPLVTYISRQTSGRRLREEDHQNLVNELERLQLEGLCEVRVVAMERLSLHDQLDLAARTTVLLGVHGNGLTHQLWMPPSMTSTIIEIFFPQGYLFDYEVLAENFGHKHYAVWNDSFVTYSPGTWHKGPSAPTGFHGSDIPVHAPTVSKIIRERLLQG